MPAAIGVLLVGFSELLAAARQYSAKYHYDIDIDQEMMAQGMANAGIRVVPGHQCGRQPFEERAE